LRWDPKHIVTHIASQSHIHIFTHARFSRFTYGTLVQPVTVRRWEVNIVIKPTIYFMNTYYRTKIGGSPFIPYSSAETSL